MHIYMVRHAVGLGRLDCSTNTAPESWSIPGVLQEADMHRSSLTVEEVREQNRLHMAVVECLE